MGDKEVGKGVVGRREDEEVQSPLKEKQKRTMEATTKKVLFAGEGKLTETGTGGVTALGGVKQLENRSEKNDGVELDTGGQPREQLYAGHACGCWGVEYRRREAFSPE